MTDYSTSEIFKGVIYTWQPIMGATQHLARAVIDFECYFEIYKNRASFFRAPLYRNSLVRSETEPINYHIIPFGELKL